MVTDAQVRQWLADNPQATDDQIYVAMKQYGVTPDQMSRATGVNIAEVNRRFEAQINQSLANNSQVADEQIRQWLRDNPQATDEQVLLAMKQYGVSPEQIARATGTNIGDVNQRIDAQINQYLANNPQATDAQIYQTMNQFGITPEQVARAQNVNVESIMPRINAVIEQQSLTPVGQTPTGLRGFEAAANRGMNQAIATQQAAQQAARGDLSAGMQEVARLYGLNLDDLRAAQTAAQASLNQAAQSGRQLYQTNIDDLRAAQQVAQGNLTQAMQAGRGLYGENIAGIQAAGERARGDLQNYMGQAAGLFQPYQQAGTQALQQQLALSGALGQDAFNQAYQESPYIRFLREQGERSTLAGAAATGGLGGGRVQQELVRFGQGLAGQGLQQQIGNLSNLTGVGLGAAGSGANILTGLGTNLANLGTGTAQSVAGQRENLAGLESQYGTNLANLATGTAQNIGAQRGALVGLESQLGTNLANLATGTAQNIAGQRQNLAGAQGQYATNLANMGIQTGGNIANLQYGTAADIANQRMQAGQLLAGQVGTAAAGLGDLASAQGNYLSDILNRYGTAGLGLSQGYTQDQINAYQQAAENQAASQQGFAVNQANMLAGQPFAQMQPFSYGQAAGNALNAAALGYQLGGGNLGVTTRPTQVSGSAPGMQPMIMPQFNWSTLYSDLAGLPR